MKVVKRWAPVRYLHELTCQKQSDGELLRRYAEGRDEEAFAELVRRTGPQVFRTCCHVLGEVTAAEDAFQATFLLLARKASRLAAAGSVAGWLHKTAQRIAQDARRAETRRRRHERAAAEIAKPKEEPSWREVRERLDAELAALPEKYRTPLVLCYLQDLTYEEAARRSGCTMGALRGRLERGKEMLRKRLAKCGQTLGAPVLALGKPAAVSATLVQATLTTVRTALAGGVIAPAVAGLIGTTAWVKGLIVALIVVAAAGVGLGLALFGGVSGEPLKPTPLPIVEQKAPPVPKMDLFGDPLPPGAVQRLGTVRFRHQGRVGPVLFMPDGKTVLSSSDDGIRFWDVATGKQSRTLRLPLDAKGAPRNEFAHVALSSDGKRLVSCGASDRAQLRLWDVAAGKELPWDLAPGFRPEKVLFSPDDQTLALVVGPEVVFIRVATGKETSRLKAHKEIVGDFAFSPDGKRLATCAGEGDDRMIRLWELATGKELLQLKSLRERDYDFIKFSPDGRQLLSGGGWYVPTEKANYFEREGRIRLWDLEAGKAAHELQPVEKGFAYKYDSRTGIFSPDGRLVATLLGQRIDLWDIRTGKQVRTLQEQRLGVGPSYQTLAFSPDGKTLAAANENTVDLWDVDSGKRRHNPETGHQGEATAIAVSPNGRHLASGGTDHTVRLWDLDTGKMLQVFTGKTRMQAVTFSPDGKTVAAGDSGGTVWLWDTATGQERARLQADGSVYQVAFSPDGLSLAGGQTSFGFEKVEKLKKPAIHVWDMATGKERLALPPRRVWLYGALTFSSDGRLILSAHYDGSLRIWEQESGKAVAEHLLHGANAQAIGVSISADGMLAASSYQLDRSVNVWATVNGNRRLELPIKDTKGFRMAFSSDNRFLVTCPILRRAGDDANEPVARVWELVTGKEVMQVAMPPDNWVKSMTLGRNGASLLTGMEDTTVLVWPLVPEAPRRALVAKELDQHWTDLANADAACAYRAMRFLAASPEEANGLIGKRFRPIEAADPKHLQQLIARLNDKEFATRNRAAEELEKTGELAEPALRAALKQELPLEANRRVGKLLDKLASRTTAAPEELQALRAVAVLEWIGSAEAIGQLRRLAGGARASWVTQDAQAALERLARRPPG